ncbi:MAG: Blue-light-activated protein [Planctomycetaceae bacterium]|nr:Blue-light-activated protein [Planctomycetaceae bacterium]
MVAVLQARSACKRQIFYENSTALQVADRTESSPRNVKSVMNVARSGGPMKNTDKNATRGEELLLSDQSRDDSVPAALLAHDVDDYATVVLDPAGCITSWDQGAERLTGFTAREAVGRSLSEFHPASEVARGRPLSELQDSAKRRRVSHEGWMLHKRRGQFLALSLTFPLQDQTGNPVGFSRVLLDITSRRRDEESLRCVTVHSVDAIFAIDESGTIQSCGGAAQKIFGYSSSELIGRPVNFLMPEPWRSEHDGYILSYLHTGIAKVIGNVREVTGLRKDGSTIPLELAVTEFRFNSARYFTGILRDVTERKKLEQQLRQSQKMEAIGQLAGGIAHDFNNLLTVIIGFSEMVLGALSEEDANRGLMAEVVKAGNRAASLTRQLLAFSRKQLLVPMILDLNAVVDNCHRLLRRLIGENIVLTVTCDPAIRRIKADPGQLEQVIINLAVNARDAMPEGGDIRIETFDIELNTDQCQQYPGIRPGSYVVLRMTDNGCGMTAEVKSHLFEPFFTTKDVGKGTGLGLAMIYGIVKQSDGYIAVESTDGIGTTVSVFLPATRNLSVDLSKTCDVTPPYRGNETVLLVEDENGVRRLARQILETQGYRVLDAGSGHEALQLIQTPGQSIQILITDVVMPGMNGRQLVEALLLRYPNLKILYISGHTDDAIVQHGIRDASHAFLQKPFSMMTLAKKVRDVLDGIT